MKNNKGFSTIELLVSFVIISFISIAMFRAVLVLNNKLYNFQSSINLIIFNGTFTNGMTKDLMSNQIDNITTCGTNCYDITYQTLATKRLMLDSNKGLLQYGDIIQKLPEGAKFDGDITFDNVTNSGIAIGRKNSILRISVPISSDNITGDYSINVIYQYDNRLITVPIPLVSRFSIASAGNNGTYQFKNGSNYFVGPDPYNWIEFGQVSSSNSTPLLWRIVKYDSSGIKIIYEGAKNGGSAPTADGKATITGLTSLVWDSSNVNKYETPATMKLYLETWYGSLYAANKDSYVQPVQWCIGATGSGINYSTEPVTINDFKNYECADGTYTGGTFLGKTASSYSYGLILPSDYISTSSASTCTGSYQTTGNNTGKDCGILANGTVTNFLYKSNYDWWTMEARAVETTYVWRVSAVGYLGGGSAANTALYVRPVINLKTTVLYNGGDGTLANPYRISLP